MKKSLRRLMPLLFFLFCIPLTVSAVVRITIGGVEYSSISDNTVAAALTVKAVGDVEIAQTVNIKGRKYTTTRIIAAFFKKNDYLQSVVIPASVVQIEANAFRGCTNMTRAVIKNPDCDIAQNAFEGCLALNDIQKGDQEKPATAGTPAPAVATVPTSPVDTNIPQARQSADKTFAVIIGNENYQHVASVPFAQHDAEVFALYCKQTLGMPEQNVRSYTNATYGTLLTAMRDIKSIAKAYQGDIHVVFYYAGHGIPDEATHDAFLLPTDADGQVTDACYPVSRLYKELGSLGAQSVVVFMDACFSGAQRGEGMLASARGVALKAKAEAPNGNMVVFSAATGDETAYPYKEKGHGLFTYFLLKKLQDSKGKCTLGELSEYIKTNVAQQSVVINRKSQTPTVVPSSGMGNSWKDMRFQ